MSRSNPTEGVRNPSTRWFEWAGGSDGGYVRWYNKDTKEQVKADPFTFLLLDELSTVKGWHESSESGIYANEVRDTRQDALVVRAFKGGELASGTYAQIRDRIVAVGGHYVASLYIAYKDDGDGLKIGNLALKGAAAGAWMDFKRNAQTKAGPSGKTRAYLVDAVKIASYEQKKKGGTVYRVPVFTLSEVSAATNDQACALDAELQSFIAEYLKRPKAAAATPAQTQDDPDPDEQAAQGMRGVDTFEDDIPFVLNECMYDVGNAFERRQRRASTR